MEIELSHAEVRGSMEIGFPRADEVTGGHVRVCTLEQPVCAFVPFRKPAQNHLR